ncbi:MAG: hypothetical protein FJ221_13005, partial [Lentisphaerae bacterium]|nr:hypothetical protein [Lentisphaerota bacterium]
MERLRLVRAGHAPGRQPPAREEPGGGQRGVRRRQRPLGAVGRHEAAVEERRVHGLLVEWRRGSSAMAHRILSFDGGGIRGLLTVILLERLEREVQGWIDRADLLAGTSTGALIALGLARGMSPTEVRELYERHGREIFHDTWLDNIQDLGRLAGAGYDNVG